MILDPNGGGADYAALIRSDGKWRDRSGSNQYYSIMEIPCSNGGGGSGNPPVVNQISGPANGDNFLIGETEVAYEVTDDCGNLEICKFIVTVEENPAQITLEGLFRRPYFKYFTWCPIRNCRLVTTHWYH